MLLVCLLNHLKHLNCLCPSIYQNILSPHGWHLTPDRGEDHAATLENNLSGFEKKIDALLGSIDEPSTAERHAAAKEKAGKESAAKDNTNEKTKEHQK